MQILIFMWLSQKTANSPSQKTDSSPFQFELYSKCRHLPEYLQIHILSQFPYFIEFLIILCLIIKCYSVLNNIKQYPSGYSKYFLNIVLIFLIIIRLHLMLELLAKSMDRWQ